MAKGGDRNQEGSKPNLNEPLQRDRNVTRAWGQQQPRNILLADAPRVWWLRHLAGKPGGTPFFVSRANHARKSRCACLGESEGRGANHTQGLSGQQRCRTGNARKGRSSYLRKEGRGSVG